VLNQILEEKYYLKVEHVINLLKMPFSPKVVRLLLEQLYLECFQAPFSLVKETHFSTLLYPHVNLVNMKTGGYSESS
jgi:predicted membrane chloride channel (bestrophin family)